MSKHFNRLQPPQLEALALLAEECAEVVQIIGKILRHGLDSTHPDGGPTNQQLLVSEIGDVRAAAMIVESVGLVHEYDIRGACIAKLGRVGRYLHHINYAERAIDAAQEQDK